MLWIVSGPSSAGKSHFLASPRARALTGLPATTRVWFPKEVGPGAPSSGDDAFVHYNILRPAQLMEKRGLPPAQWKSQFRFDMDPQWLAIAALPQSKKAIVVVAPRDVLLARVAARSEIEPGETKTYGVERWRRIYDAVNLDRVYELWREELTARGIPHEDVDGSGRAT